MTTTLSAGHTVARNTIFLLLGQLAVRVLGFIPLILLANYLGVDGYGSYNFALAFAMLFVPLCDLGIDTMLIREIASRPGESAPLGRSALGFKSALGVATVCLIAAAALVEGSGQGRIELLILAGVFVVLRTFPLTFGAFFRGAQRMALDAIFTIIAKLLEISAMIITVVAALSVVDLFLLLIGSAVLALLFSAILARRTGFPILPRMSIPAFRDLLRGGLPFALLAISVTFNVQIGTVILGYLLDEGAVGLYRSAFNLIIALGGFSAAISIALYPAVAQHYQENRAQAVHVSSQAITYALLLGLPVAAGCTAIAPNIIGFIYAPEYAGASDTLRILSCWIPVMYVNAVLGYILAAIKKQNLLLTFSLASAPLNIALNLVLIPVLGHDGAAAANVATELTLLVFLSTAVQRHFGSVFALPALAKIASASLLLIPLGFVAGVIHVIPLLIGGVLVYAFAIVALGVVRLADLSRAWSLLLGRQTSAAEGH